jgi:RNA polymerase sigma-70 factor (ECF subfamily)
VAETFKGRAQAAKPALVDGEIGIAVAFGGRLRIVLVLTMTDGKIAEINAIADSERLRQFDVTALD